MVRKIREKGKNKKSHTVIRFSALTRGALDLLRLAKDDALGRQLQDLNLITRKRAPRRNK